MGPERRFAKIDEYNGWTLEVEELTDKERALIARNFLARFIRLLLEAEEREEARRRAKREG